MYTSTYYKDKRLEVVHTYALQFSKISTGKQVRVPLDLFLELQAAHGPVAARAPYISQDGKFASLTSPLDDETEFMISQPTEHKSSTKASRSII